MQSPAIVENKSGTQGRNSGYNSKNQSLNSSQASSHVVKEGDTLYAISRMYNVNFDRLIHANNLVEPYVIKKGLRLQIPSSTQSHDVESEFVNSGAETGFGEGRGETFPSESKFSPVVEKELEDLKPQKFLQPEIIEESKGSIESREIQEIGTDLQERILPNEVKLNSIEKSDDLKDLDKPSVDKSLKVLALNDFPKPQFRPSDYPKPSLRPDIQVESDKKVAYMDALYQPEVPAVEKPKSVSSSGFAWPAKGKIISKFGAKEGGLYNDGINISASEGASVIAADNGTVVYAGNELRGYGNMILLKHSNGYVTAYAHASDLFVKKGDTVEKGQKIASVGSTGHVSAPQLHFSIRKGRKAIDPQSYLPKS